MRREAFDSLTALAADVFDAPAAFVTVVEDARQWFRARRGAEGWETPLNESFCVHTIQGGPGAVLVVEDATRDPRFSALRPVLEEGLRFYAGATVTTATGRTDGAVCVIDTKPRDRPSEAQMDALRHLAELAGRMIDAQEAEKAQALALAKLKMAETLGGMGHWRMALADGGLDWSDAMFRIHGLEPGQIDPRDYRTHVDYDAGDTAASQLMTQRMLQTGEGYETRLRFRRADGAARTAQLRVALERGPDGQPLALFGVQQDITTAVQQADALSKMVETLKLAEAMAGVGHWRMDLRSGQVVWSDVVYRIHGLDRAQHDPSLVDALAFYHPEDRAELGAAIQRALETGEGFSLKSRLVRADGETRVVVSHGTREVDAEGRPTGVFGVFQDVTEHERAALRVAESEAKYRGLADRSSDLIISYGLDGIVTYVSPAIRALKGVEPERVIGRPLTDLIHPDDVAELSEGLGRFINSGGQGQHQVRYRLVDGDGQLRWCEARTSLIRDGQGRVAAVQDIVRDVTETKRLEEALIEARDRAEAGARAKSEFLANMSHELRTPLTSVVGFSGLLQASQALPDAERRFADRIATASEALLSVINDILDYSKLEADSVELEPLPFTPLALAQDAAAIVEGQCLSKGLTLRVDVDGSVPGRMVGDGGRIRQVLLNFLSNAVKFTANGEVALVMTASGEGEVRRLRAEVRDSGIGIPADKIAALFERFTQADASTTRTHGGTGLGLAISRRLIEMMDGEIGAESRLGEGSVFWFEVPLPVAEAGDAAPRAATDLDGSGLTGARILVADDAPANRELVSVMLGGLGMTVDAVRDGAEAVAAVKDGAYDLVLMDVVMPVMDGPTATAAIRQLPGGTSRTPIIALTANTSADQVATCLAAGMDSHVAKPIQISELARTVGVALAAHRARKQGDAA